MTKDTREFCKTCEWCQWAKDSNMRPASKLHSLPVPIKPWELIEMDFVGPFPKVTGFNYLWDVVCKMMSMVHMIPVNTTWHMQCSMPQHLPQCIGGLYCPPLIPTRILSFWRIPVGISFGSDAGQNWQMHSSEMETRMNTGIRWEFFYSMAYIHTPTDQHKQCINAITTGHLPNPSHHSFPPPPSLSTTTHIGKLHCNDWVGWVNNTVIDSVSSGEQFLYPAGPVYCGKIAGAGAVRHLLRQLQSGLTHMFILCLLGPASEETNFPVPGTKAGSEVFYFYVWHQMHINYKQGQLPMFSISFSIPGFCNPLAIYPLNIIELTWTNFLDHRANVLH